MSWVRFRIIPMFGQLFVVVSYEMLATFRIAFDSLWTWRKLLIILVHAIMRVHICSLPNVQARAKWHLTIGTIFCHLFVFWPQHVIFVVRPFSALSRLFRILGNSFQVVTLFALLGDVEWNLAFVFWWGIHFLSISISSKWRIDFSITAWKLRMCYWELRISHKSSRDENDLLRTEKKDIQQWYRILFVSRQNICKIANLSLRVIMFWIDNSFSQFLRKNQDQIKTKQNWKRNGVRIKSSNIWFGRLRRNQKVLDLLLLQRPTKTRPQNFEPFQW